MVNIKNRISEFEKNQTGGRDFVVGDIHGMYDMFMDNLDILNFNQTKDRVFSVGDLVDRGPRSLECLRLLKEDWFFATRGNHEDMALGYLSNEDAIFDYLFEKDQELYINGQEWLLSLSAEEKLEVISLIKEMPVYIEINNEIGLVHAEPPTDWSDIKHDGTFQLHLDNALWGRTRVRNKVNIPIKNIWNVYCGHTPMRKPTSIQNSHHIDTGAVFGWSLTIKEIEYEK